VKLGWAGRLADVFTTSKLTPLAVLASLLVGLFALSITPREEEPQIIVPMVDVTIPFPGAVPREVEDRITVPVEKLLWGLPDVEYIYSASRHGGALITVRFKVGTPLEPAVVRIHHRLREHLPETPDGIGMPLVRSYTIDDVPFLALTLHGGGADDFALRKAGLEMARELSEITDISQIDVIGGEPRQVRILPDPKKLAERHVSLLEHFGPLLSGNVGARVGTSRGTDPEWLVEVGGFFSSAEEVAGVVVGIKGGRAVRVGEVARVIDGPAERSRQVLFVRKGSAPEPAVTLSFAKRPGTNATALANRVLEKAEAIGGRLMPAGASVSVTRNYGETAKDKSDTLIEHLLIASLSVVVLIAFFLGIRPALVVGVAVPVTLALTLLIYYLFGYTLNRVTLFALIFSIGILVDDAIVVVENIHRHIHEPALRSKRKLTEIIVAAVDEVGNPTILATFTVIAAILPMAFVSGLMGPYMRPIPVGASMAMLFSLVIAFTVSPWAARLSHAGVYRKLRAADEAESVHRESGHPKTRLDRVYDWMMSGLLDRRSFRAAFLGIIALCFVAIAGLVAGKIVRVKTLPFDNKSEFQVVIDLDEGTPLTRTVQVAAEMGRELESLPELTDYQVYAGTSAPVNFNGLVRHYFLRSAPYQADLQVNLVPRGERKRQSHEIAKAIRPALERIASARGARVKVVEIPPGPPVLSTLVAEIFGPSHEEQIRLAGEVKRWFRETEGVVDVDWSVPHAQKVKVVAIDRRAASLKGVPVDRLQRAVAAAVGGVTIGQIHEGGHPEPVEIRLQIPEENRKDFGAVLNLTVPSNDGSFVPIGSLARIDEKAAEPDILRKNLQRVVYVFGDLAGREEAPVYAIAKLGERLKGMKDVRVHSSAQPETTDRPALKWDGEWQITYEVFRDLGIAFAVVLVLIYLLVVGWFESFLVPLIIMIPIPLSLVGIVPGHWMFGAFFTATSMIGFIAGAGIIVRNSIILVDFIEQKLREGRPLREAVIEAGEVRFRPMLLTAAAVVVGSFVILFDPIFQGLAISLMMGEVAATLLSRFAVPLLYYVVAGKSRAAALAPR
jgi:multidrug efflux pump subunit AcrB